MNKFKKIIIVIHLLAFIIYAVTPVVASMPLGVSDSYGQSLDDSPVARLLIIDMIAGDSGGAGSVLSASDSDGVDILLKKKRTLNSKKFLLQAVLCSSLAPRQSIDNDHVQTHVITKPAYYSSLQYFVSGVSPPSLS